MATAEKPRPIRAGVFDTVEEAGDAIRDLHAAGFAQDEISVVCSDPALTAPFIEYVDQQPAGARTNRALTRATIWVLILAAIAVVALLFVGTLTAYVIAGICLGVGLLSVFGSTMMTRGSERELSDYYSQAVEPGKLLVAVELADDAPPEKLAAADRVFLREAEARTSLPHEA